MMRQRLTGMGVALVTPFTENGDIDFTALERLVQMHIDAGTAFLCVLGTTAETPTLTAEEKREIRKRVIKQVAGRLPIMVGIGGNCTRAVVEEIKNEDLTGVDAILSVAPYYNRPSQEGIYLHYKAISEATSLPIYMYNVPGRTGVNILPSTVVRVANDCPNIVGYKAASGDMEQIKELIATKPENFDVFSGDDALTFDIMSAGGVGVISVFGNAFPREMTQLVSAVQEGRIDDARIMNESLKEFFRLIFVDGNPSGVKALMNIQGRLENVLRLPLVPAREETCRLLKQAIATIHG
ncbi:MAG: 4-hydroxy-tetrahydrodipicolinate synthase [Bacteroidales bacterium]|nr:4-hydroxy-tetrahydrodipicolinate synthase [Bacteroidales bacterium]